MTIGRFSATLHDDGSARPGEAGLTAPLRCVVDGGLALALREVRLPEGRWCVRRLRLSLPLDLDRPGPDGGRVWSVAVAAAIERAVREGGGEVVHYRHDVDLLADLVAGAAAGRTVRHWAWQQAGALRPGDPAPGVEPRAAVLAALGRAPQHVAAALLRATPVCGLPALDRLFGEQGWQAVAGLAAVASWCGPAPAGPGHDGPVPAPARALARTLLAGSVLAGLARSARLRPGPATLAAWAVLAAAEADPGSLHRRPHPDLPRALAQELGAVLGQATPPGRDRPAAPPVPTTPSVPAPSVPAPAVPAPVAAVPEPMPDSSPTVEATRPHPPAPDEEPPATPSPSDPAPDPATPHRPPQPSVAAPDTPGGACTAWAGLLFLLAAAPDAGLPQRALDHPALTARPLRWVLHRLGRELLPEAAPDDAALLALAGLGPARAAVLLAAPPPTEPERTAVRALSAAWASATCARLGDRELEDATAVRAVARRSGEVCAEPGWIEVRLSVADTDLTVRRAGLDLDPGWVPWLGAVVRYVYV
ncbi:hypothetical protein VM95_26370 [Streptomyces rubellomurinus]|uniref:Uncharacterized protein n=1 Tax=Streptomyces rubellomurinus (strain ATCC 31215) TaxID=359131 RepID=A0A0F2TCY5_STRR3|nr:hypothetical protein VM95_26370 [Streptomyces rubellomurinus]